jgi:hypothetical protein
MNISLIRWIAVQKTALDSFGFLQEMAGARCNVAVLSERSKKPRLKGGAQCRSLAYFAPFSARLVVE